MKKELTDEEVHATHNRMVAEARQIQEDDLKANAASIVNSLRDLEDKLKGATILGVNYSLSPTAAASAVTTLYIETSRGMLKITPFLDLDDGYESLAAVDAVLENKDDAQNG